jgi:hypothetical protein
MQHLTLLPRSKNEKEEQEEQVAYQAASKKMVNEPLQEEEGDGKGPEQEGVEDYQPPQQRSTLPCTETLEGVRREDMGVVRLGWQARRLK